MLWPQMTAYHSRRQSRRGDSPEANLALAISAATGAERPFLFGDTAAAGGGWLRWGLCQERSEMHCSQCPFLLSQGFSRLKLSSTQNNREVWEPRAPGIGSFLSLQGQSSQVAMGFHQRKVKQEGDKVGVFLCPTKEDPLVVQGANGFFMLVLRSCC